MRIAVTGTHGSGKTTLIDDFLDVRRDFAHEQEPYLELAEAGVSFADGPNVADLETQLEQSLSLILGRAADARVIFDRSPIDYLAYLEVVAAREQTEWAPTEKLLNRVEQALEALDLLVFLPLQRPDDINIPIEYPRLRVAVDRQLKAILRDDTLDLFAAGKPRILEIHGTRARRLALLTGAVEHEAGI